MRGRKRTRCIITVSQMKAFNEIKNNMTLDRIFNNTSIFKESLNGSPLDELTVVKIKESFELWFNSWIKPNLEKL